MELLQGLPVLHKIGQIYFFNQSILFQKYTANKYNWCVLLNSSLEPWSQDESKDGLPHIARLFPFFVVVFLLLIVLFQIVFFSIELPFMSIKWFSDGLLSYDLQVKKCSMVSSLTSQATQKLSLYFHGCNFFTQKARIRADVVTKRELYLTSRVS